jgi:hypothetical protein
LVFRFGVIIFQLIIFLSSKAECELTCNIDDIDDIDLNIETVELSNCEFGDLEVNPFVLSNGSKALSKITNIDLSINYITVITDLSFSRATKLKTLDLSYNEISTIKKATFHKLPHLEEISLCTNKLSFLDWDWFVENDNLKTLDVSENMLVNIIGTTENIPIQSLDLQKNYLEDVSKVNVLKKLINLQLDNNLQMKFDESTLKDNLELKLLSLENTNLKYSSNFNFLRNTPKLTSLFLNENNLENIKISNLPTLPSLNFLSLRNSNLQKLDYENIKKKFPNLNVINLMANNFDCVYLEKLLNYLVISEIKLNNDNACKLYSSDQIKGIDCVKSNQIKIIMIIIGAIVATVVIICTTLLVDRYCFPRNFNVNNTVVAFDGNQFQKTSDENMYESIRL